MLEKFSEWEYDTDWWGRPAKRFPYLGRPENGKALLTTASNDNYADWGTIIANQSDDYVPAKWMSGEMKSPGLIWYWVNENDCDRDYRKSLFLLLY